MTKRSIDILVVEDEKEAAETLCSVLYAAGHNATVVASGKEALRMLKDFACSVVIAELRLPDMSGADLARAVREYNAHISTIVITPYLFINSAIEALEAGAFCYITKPLNPAEIRVAVEHAHEHCLLLEEAKKKSYYFDLSTIDGLTGVYNHRYLHEVLDREIARARRYPQHMSVAMVDVDNFKKYNDTNGHPAGDELLKGIANLFVRALRSQDMVFRYGGEEFLLLLIETDKKSAVLAVERILNLVRLSLPTTVSVGIADYPTDAAEKDVLVERADKALYQAKTTGKDKFCLA